MGATVPRTLTNRPAPVYDAVVIPDTGPRWYETPLWFAAQAAVTIRGQLRPRDD